MSGILGFLFPGTDRDPALDAAVERVVERIEPRLKYAGGYPQRYRPAVAHALEYAHGLAGQVPGPIHIDREAYVKDPVIRAFFASPDEFQQALCMSQAMQHYIHDNGCRLGSPVYALMGMRRKERGVMGSEMVGEVIRHDVPLTAVSFSDHTLSHIAPSEAEARELLTWGFLDSLLETVRSQIDALREEKAYLDQKRGDLTARLHSADLATRTQLEEELDALQPKYQFVSEQLDLRRYAAHIESVLLQPEAFLRLEPQTLCLDDMNIKREDGPNVRRLDLTDLIGRDRRRWTICLLHCRQPGAVSTTAQLDKACRWLNI